MRPATSDIGVSSGRRRPLGDRLVSDARHFTLEHLLCQLKFRCEMQVGETAADSRASADIRVQPAL